MRPVFCSRPVRKKRNCGECTKINQNINKIEAKRIGNKNVTIKNRAKTNRICKIKTIQTEKSERRKGKKEGEKIEAYKVYNFYALNSVKSV